MMMMKTMRSPLLDDEVESLETPTTMEPGRLKRLRALSPVDPAAKSPLPNVKHKTKKATSNPKRRDPTTMPLILPSLPIRRARLARPATTMGKTAAPLVVVLVCVSALPNLAVIQKLPMSSLRNFMTCEVADRNAVLFMKSFRRSHAVVARKLITVLFDPSTFYLLRMLKMISSPSLPPAVDAAEVVAAGNELFSLHMDLSAVLAHRLSWLHLVHLLRLVVLKVTAVMMKACTKLSLLDLSPADLFPKLTPPIPLRIPLERLPILAKSRTGRHWQMQTLWELTLTSTLTVWEVCKVTSTS
jgi:hypothetical protein